MPFFLSVPLALEEPFRNVTPNRQMSTKGNTPYELCQSRASQFGHAQSEYPLDIVGKSSDNLRLSKHPCKEFA
jgi:hypothetical protein